MFSLTIIAICLSASFAYFQFFSESKTAKFLNFFPGPKSYPLVGNLLQLKNPEEEGDRYRFSFGSRSHCLVLTNMKDLEKIIQSPSLLNKGQQYDYFPNWIGDGLLISKSGKWRPRTKLLTPAFHFTMVELFQQVSNEQSMVLIEIMKRKHKENEACQIHHMFSLCALSIICEAALGSKLRCQEEPDVYVYTDAVIKQSKFVFKRFVSPWLHNDFIWSRSTDGKAEKKNLAILHEFINKVIADRKNEYMKTKMESFEDEVYGASEQSPGKKRLAFLDLLIEMQSSAEANLTDKDIYDETATFTFEGHDTTAAGLTWGLYLLAKHPENQDKVHQELEEIFGKDRTRDITTSDLTKMKYLECCVKESLRIYPSVPNVTRRVDEDVQFDDGSVIPAGINVFISPWVIHRKLDLYPEPEKFIPERFTQENVVGRHPYAYLPFSAGSRNCIGQKVAFVELKTVMANIFRNFIVRLASLEQVVTALPELIVRPKDDIGVLLEIKQ